MLVQIPFLIVMCLIAVAAVYLLVDRWRRGALVFGSAALVAAVMRAVLPTSRVGLLQVRGRVADVVSLAVCGALVLWLATSIDSLGTN
ncbi:DUF3017 domain-containing protein [Gordonia jinhuaensis]|uniref:DUF3017 domain-containing protein n=1 Tax=Gordonia jinhuaensis TaxID=1517702 RepID=UPI00357120F1